MYNTLERGRDDMLDTFLFDLDGTLLPMDIDKFIYIYFSQMGSSLKNIIEPELLAKYIWKATEDMVKNTDYKTNEEIFMESFSRLVSGNIEDYKKKFDNFYDSEFKKTKEATFKLPIVKECISLLKSKGYTLAIATNPLFPAKAIYHRIQWAGLNLEDFIYISSYEHNHYCKPQIHFYKEVLKDIEKSPEQCMMVGNDVQEDLVALKLGIKTFLITDYLIHRNEDHIETTYRGNYDDFYKFIEELPAL